MIFITKISLVSPREPVQRVSKLIIIRLHRMHVMQTIVTKVCGVCLSVCPSHNSNWWRLVQCTPRAVCTGSFGAAVTNCLRPLVIIYRPFSESFKTSHSAIEEVAVIGVFLLLSFVSTQSLLPLVKFLIPAFLYLL